MIATKTMLLDRVILNRKSRDVRFYLRKNTHKKCFSNLSEEQVKDIASIIQKAGKNKTENLAFDDETFILAPTTKREVR
jgi:hypothetical protein